MYMAHLGLLQYVICIGHDWDTILPSVAFHKSSKMQKIKKEVFDFLFFSNFCLFIALKLLKKDVLYLRAK